MSTFIQTIDPNQISHSELHQLLLTAVAPRPICFASTIDQAGRVNLSPFSYFNVFSSNPPILIFSPARRSRDKTTKHSYQNVKEVPEVVINMVNFALVEQMSLASTEYAKGVNEFAKAGLTECASALVRPPRVGEAPLAFECQVDEVIDLGEGGGAGSLIISRVLKIHLAQKYLDAAGKLNPLKLDLVARMGGNWYTRCTPESMFEIPKPLTTKGIGVDALPAHVRNSHILTGNELGRLGNVETLPTKAEIDWASTKVEYLAIVQNSNLDFGSKLAAIHRLARELLLAGETKAAVAVVFAFTG